MLFWLVAVVVFAAAEFVIGFWALPVAGLLLGMIGARRRLVGATLASAALAAWLGLYGWTALQGHLPTFLTGLAASMQLSPAQLVSAALGLPALLAGPAGALGAGLMGLLRREPAPTAG